MPFAEGIRASLEMTRRSDEGPNMTPELGLIEGYYGSLWSWAERAAGVAALAPHGYGFHIYAPKADPYLRRRWAEPHPEPQAQALADFAQICAGHGVRFGVGLSPFEIYRDFGPEAQGALAAKLKALDALGVQDLAILFDDMAGDLPDLAATQIRILHWIAERTAASRLILCPTYYSDAPELDRIFGGLGIVTERPVVPRAVVLDRRGPEFAREIRRDERAARLIRAGDQPHRQPSAFALEIEVQTERTDGPTATARLLRVEETEEDARAGLRSRDSEAAGEKKLILFSSDNKGFKLVDNDEILANGKMYDIVKTTTGNGVTLYFALADNDEDDRHRRRE